MTDKQSPQPISSQNSLASNLITNQVKERYKKELQVLMVCETMAVLFYFIINFFLQYVFWSTSTVCHKVGILGNSIVFSVIVKFVSVSRHYMNLCTFHPEFYQKPTCSACFVFVWFRNLEVIGQWYSFISIAFLIFIYICVIFKRLFIEWPWCCCFVPYFGLHWF